MSEKGIAAAAIFGITVIITFIAAVVTVIALAPKPLLGPRGLPVHAEATPSETAGIIGSSAEFVKAGVGKENSDNMSDVPTECEHGIYTASTSTTSVTEILDWYKTEMAGQGWELLYEDNHSYSEWGVGVSWDILYFDREDRTAAVITAQYEDEIYFALVEGPELTFDTWMYEAGHYWEE